MPSAFSSSTVPFIKKNELAASGQTFCMEGARLVTAKDGREFWLCTIFLMEDDILVEKALPFDRSQSRDGFFEGKNTTQTWPTHECKLIDRPFKNKKTGMMQNFYDLDFASVPKDCPCGELDKVVPDLDDLDDSDEHPF